MRIKRFVAPDMRTALRMVREEQGPDAVILSNRPAEGGIEIVAATDYDEALVQQALRAAAPSLVQAAPVVQLQAPRTPVHAHAANTDAAPVLVAEAACVPAATRSSRADAMIAALSAPNPPSVREGIAARARAVFRIGEAPPPKHEEPAPTLAELIAVPEPEAPLAVVAPRIPTGEEFRALLARLA
ncbi:MAG: hypothetical protein ACJ8GK_07855, partial [Luteimonas sp.]